MVTAFCLRCGDTFSADDQAATVRDFTAHQDTKHAGLPPTFSFSQPEDAAATQAAQDAAAAQAPLAANAATMTDRVVQALGNLETAAANWGTLTPAQKDQATRLTVQVVCRLARLMLRRLDTAT